MHTELTHVIISLPGVVGDVLAQATPVATPSPTPSQDASQIPLSSIVVVRGLTLGAVAFVLGLLVGNPVINWLRDRGIGKHIRTEGPAGHEIARDRYALKVGTPTMGGLIF